VPGPSRTPVTELVTLYCTWRPSALSIRPWRQVATERYIQYFDSGDWTDCFINYQSCSSGTDGGGGGLTGELADPGSPGGLTGELADPGSPGTSILVLLIVRLKCALAASHAAPW